MVPDAALEAVQVLLGTRLGYGLVPVPGNQRMNREERIEQAHRRTMEHAAPGLQALQVATQPTRAIAIRAEVRIAPIRISTAAAVAKLASHS